MNLNTCLLFSLHFLGNTFGWIQKKDDNQCCSHLCAFSVYSGKILAARPSVRWAWCWHEDHTDIEKCGINCVVCFPDLQSAVVGLEIHVSILLWFLTGHYICWKISLSFCYIKLTFLILKHLLYEKYAFHAIINNKCTYVA